MRIVAWLGEELKTIAVVMAYFTACFWIVMVLKTLFLEAYDIRFSGLMTALVAAAVTAKVVVILEKVRLDRWLDGRPLLVDVLAKTALYASATVALLLAEKAFESRAEHGGFTAALAAVTSHKDIPTVWATAIVVALAFLAYNLFNGLKREIGDDRFWHVLWRGDRPQRNDR